MVQINSYATDVVKQNYFKSIADTYLDRLPVENFAINQKHKVATNSISGVLVGHVVEMFYNILLCEPNVMYQIDTSVKKHKKLHNLVCKFGFQKLDGSWVVYDEKKYQMIIHEFELNELHEFTNGIEGLGVSVTKKKYILHEVEVHEEKGFKWIKNTSYYGSIILRLERLARNFQEFTSKRDVINFLSLDCVSDLILFTNISRNW